jgi:hypothetical protein
MNVERTLKLSEEFHNMSQLAITEAFEQAARYVHIQVTYHRPDAPVLVQDFTWGTDDILVPAMKLIDMMSETSKAFDRAGGAYAIEQAINDLEDVIDAVHRDIELAKHLPSEFTLMFRDEPKAAHLVLIQDVPFQKLQNLLRHWHNNLTDQKTGAGALSQVTIAHEPRADMRKPIMPTAKLH